MLVGVSFLAFVLVVSVWTLAIAISIAIKPGERKLAVFRPLSACIVLAILSATAAALSLTFKTAADASEVAWSAVTAQRLLAGLAESMVIPVLGFSALAVSWLLVAFGFRRQA
jgi:hypothetical protein